MAEVSQPIGIVDIYKCFKSLKDEILQLWPMCPFRTHNMSNQKFRRDGSNTAAIYAYDANFAE